MVAELLRDPLGAAEAAERPDGRGDGSADLAGVRLLAALQRGGEQGVGADGGVYC
jgi:hypothetical protein